MRSNGSGSSGFPLLHLTTSGAGGDQRHAGKAPPSRRQPGAALALSAVKHAQTEHETLRRLNLDVTDIVFTMFLDSTDYRLAIEI